MKECSASLSRTEELTEVNPLSLWRKWRKNIAKRPEVISRGHSESYSTSLGQRKLFGHYWWPIFRHSRHSSVSLTGRWRRSPSPSPGLAPRALTGSGPAAVSSRQLLRLAKTLLGGGQRQQTGETRGGMTESGITMIQSETSPNKEDEATITEAASEMEAVPDPASEMEAVPDPDPGPPALGARVDGGPDPAPGARAVTDTQGKIK